MKEETLVVKTNGMTICAVILAPHLGCIFGQIFFALSTNSFGTFLSDQTANLPKLLQDYFNPAMTFYAVEFAIENFHAPGIAIALSLSILAISTCIILKRWAWLALVLLFTFISLEFLFLNAWKV